MALYGAETDGALLNLPIFSASWGGGKEQKPGSRGEKTFTRGEGDPAVCVLNAIKAKRVSGASLEFCTWKDDSTHPEVIHPFSDQNDLFRVYELPQRRAAHGPLVHSWSYGIRLGDKASGAWSNCVSDLKQPKLPPVLRKINWRELFQFLQAPNKLGLPTSWNTDAQLGWSVFTYMSSEILFDKCDGAKSILLRIEGYCSKGHEGGQGIFGAAR